MEHSRRKPLSQRFLAIFLAFLMVFSGGLFSHKAEAAGEPTEVEQVDQGAPVNLDNTTGPIDSIEPLVTEESVEPIEPVEPIAVDPVDPGEVENPEDPVSSTAVITATFESKYSTTPEVMTVATAGETVILPSPAETTVKDGFAEYVFQGWTVENDETIYLAASEYALNTDTTFTAVWAKTTGVMIDLYRFIGEETPVKTEIYRNRTNEATAYTLTNQATGEVINSNPKMSRRETLSFQDVPAGNYTLTMDLPADSAMHHFSVYSNATVTSENTATLVVPQDSGVFTNFSLYLEQDPNLIEYTTLTFDLNGGKLVNPENYTLDEEGNVVFTNQKYETFTQREQWIQLHDTKTIYHDSGTYDYWAYRTENGARVNNATVLRNNMIAEGWTDTTLVAVWKIVEPTSYTVTIDPNGGTINEEYRVTEVTPGETYTVPYNFRSGLANSGYTLTGYTVTGTLLDTEGNPVTELSRYTGQYTPQGDVTLTANWVVSYGNVSIQLYDENPGGQKDIYSLALTAEDGTVYPLSSNQWSATHRTWRVNDVPNGTYILTIDGYNPTEVIAELTGGQAYGPGTIVANEDGSYTITLNFEDESPAAFNRFSIQEKQGKISVEVRDVNNVRTDEITITVTNEQGVVFAGSYNEYKQWSTKMTQFSTSNKYILSPGTYTITLSNLPEDTRAIVNNTVATQKAVATEENNVFTLVVEEGVDNTWAAFKLEEYVTHEITIDPNGGTINEDFRVTVVEDGETYSVPYTFQSKLANPGYSLAGYTVTGTLLDADGNAVTEIGKYPTPYTPQGDVTLTAIWEVSKGDVQIRLYDENPGAQREVYTLTLTAEDGTEYPLTSNQFGATHRTWRVDDVPNGTYTLTIEGYNPADVVAELTGGQSYGAGSIVVNEDGTYTITLDFNDESPAAFNRFSIQEKQQKISVEVRDLDNLRTDQVTITITDEDGQVFRGSYNEYKQWTTNMTQFATANKAILSAGTYTITLSDLPEDTRAVINDTVATQQAVATDEDNVFTLVVEEGAANTWAAFKLEEYITHTVTIDPYGGTIDEEYRVTVVEDGDTYSVPYTFRSNIANPGYTLTGYTVTGALLDADGNPVTEITKYPTPYTPQGDVTLTAIWEVTEGNFRIRLADDDTQFQKDKYSLKLVAEDGTEYVLTSNSYNGDYRTWQVDDIPNGSYTLVIEGPDSEILSVERTGGSYVVSESLTDNGDMTLAFNVVFEDEKPTAFVRYTVEIEEVIKHTVTIDPNGGTIDENYRVTEVVDGETYSVPYTFQSKLANPGYTLAGYTVTGTLLDAEGNAVTEITKYPTPYTPQGDVTLTAIWEVTEGNFRIHLSDDAPAIQKDKYALKLVAEDGTEYVLTSNSYGPTYRQWEVDDIPNGAYTLVIEGPDSEILSVERTGGSYVVSESLTDNGDMTLAFNVVFEDEKPTAFVRYRVEIQEVITHTVTIDPNGGTIDEEYRVTEVVDGETYSVPYTFRSNLANPGYTLAGYTVTGTLLDANGNAVTEITKHPTAYTPQGDVTLTAIWAVTDGNVRIHLADEAPSLQPEKYSLKLVAEDGTEYVLTSNSYSADYRQWEVDDVPNGSYTLVITGPESDILSIERTGGSYVVSSSLTDNGDMTLAFDVVFEDENFAGFVRYRVEIQETPELLRGWQLIDGNWYYYKEDGTPATDEWLWVEVLDQEDNAVEYNWKYFTPEGISIEQLYRENGNTWLSQDGPYDGYYKGYWDHPANDYFYYFRETSGTMVTGWQFINDNWYYFRDTGTMIADGGFAWVPVLTGEHVWKYFRTDGVNIDQYYRNDLGWVWLSQDGPYEGYYKGWLTDPENDQIYYFRETSGTRVEGFQFIDGDWRYFRMGTGTQAFGWQFINGSWYYFRDETGTRVTGSQYIDGQWVEFTADGRLIGER